MNPECPAAEDRDPPEVTRQKAALPVLPESLAPLAAVTVGVLQQRYLTAAFAGDTTLGGRADGRPLVRRLQSRAVRLGILTGYVLSASVDSMTVFRRRGCSEQSRPGLR